MSSKFPPPPETDFVADWQTILADIERVVTAARARADELAELALGFRVGYGTRDALLKLDLTGAASPLSAIAIATVLAEHAETLSGEGDHAGALGCTFVSLVTELDAQALDHTHRDRIDAMRRRAAKILDIIGPEVADERARTIKGEDVNTTRH